MFTIYFSKKITTSELKEYRFIDSEKINALTKLIRDSELKKTDNGLKLEPEEYYYITFNSTDHLIIIIGDYDGKYYSNFIRNDGINNIYIDFVSDVDVVTKIQEFLNENINIDKK